MSGYIIFGKLSCNNDNLLIPLMSFNCNYCSIVLKRNRWDYVLKNSLCHVLNRERNKINVLETYKGSELKLRLSIELGVEVSLFFMKQFGSIIFWLFHWIGKGFSKNIVGHDSSCETSITRDRVIQFYILFSILEYCFGVAQLLGFLLC